MRIHSTRIPPKRLATKLPGSAAENAEQTCTPEIQDRVSSLMFEAADARKRRSMEWSAAALAGVVAATQAGGEQIGLTVGLAVGALALGALGMGEAIKAASLTIQAADLAFEHGCVLSTDPRLPGNEYILFA